MTAPPEPSPDPHVACEHSATCGGCPLIDLPYDEQRLRKHARVAEAFAAYPALGLGSARIAPVAAAQPIAEYRTRAKLIVARGGAVGLYAKGGGHHVVDIPGCRVLAPVLARVAAALRARVHAAETAGGILAPAESTTHGCLRAVDLREVQDGKAHGVLVTFVVERSRAADVTVLEAAAHDLMKELPEVAGVAVNFHASPDGREGPRVLGSETRVLAGAARVSDRVGASIHFATFGSFVQAHRGQAERVHAILGEAVGVSRARPPRVLDLYGGSGSIALALAAAGARVMLVESFAPAAKQAAAAAEAQELEVDAVCADTGAALKALRDRGERFDAAVVNPPRRGTTPGAREALAQLGPATIAYVSCEPATLARDLAHFALLGYRADALTPLDMIPLTDEVETVAVLRRGPIAPPPVIYEDAGVLVVDKSPHEATASGANGTGSLQARVRSLPGASQAVPVHELEPGTSGLAVFVRDPARAEAWQRALASPETRLTYMAAVRGVTPSKGSIARALTEGRELVQARSRYKRHSIVGGHSVLRVVPDPQGGPRRHMILRHLASIGHPVLGDARFGHAPTNRYFEEKCGLDRTFLHASRLEVTHPETGARLVLEAPLTGDLQAVLAAAGSA
ncbi:MAG TPA: RNA methyltransferase [Polyangiaceae bacterium]|jgi:23S rRNA (uracil1939-C5)-methyltransferase|nr:RNA methyltransferase [Polyangiaceae bacterium]